MLSTFQDVEVRYKNIKPMKSKHHQVVDDVRPLGNRKRKHERMEAHTCPMTLYSL